jgi:hypothetical protein
MTIDGAIPKSRAEFLVLASPIRGEAGDRCPVKAVVGPVEPLSIIGDRRWERNVDCAGAIPSVPSHGIRVRWEGFDVNRRSRLRADRGRRGRALIRSRTSAHRPRSTLREHARPAG